MELAKAYVQIVPSAKGIKGELEKAVGGEASSAGSSAGLSLGKNLVGAIGKAVAAAGIGKMIKDAVEEGANYEQLTGGVETLFKDSADTIMQYSQEAYKTAGLSANEYMETATASAAAMISSLGGDTAKAAELTNQAVMDMSDNANKMGSDMQSIQNAYAGFAKGQFTLLDNLKIGYGGTQSEMKRLLEDATALSGIEYDINSYADIVQAIHVIQTEMEITGTTAKEASTTVSGSMASMKAAWANMLTAMASGQGVSDAFTQLSDSFLTFASNIVPMIAQVIMSMPDVLSGAIGTLIQSLNITSNNAESIVQMAVDLVTGLANSLVEGLPYLIEAALRLIGSLGEAILSFDWMGTIDELVANIKNTLTIASGEILGNDDSVITSITDGIFKAIPKLIAMMGNVMSRILSFLLESAPKLLEKGGQLIESLGKGFINNLPAITRSITQVIAKVFDILSQNLPKILQAGIDLITKLAAGLVKALPEIIKALGTISKSILDGFKQIDWAGLGMDIIRGIIKGLQMMASALWDAIVSIAREAFSSVKRFFGIGSPSRLMADEIGRFIPAGIAVGIEDNMRPLKTAMADIAETATGSFNTDVLMSAKMAPGAGGGSTVNYGGVTINVTATDVQKSRDFVDWLEQQLVMRQNNRKAAALA